MQELHSITDKFGGIDKEKATQKGYEVLPGKVWIEQDVDILVPAAMENQITGEIAPRISSKVKLIAEGANVRRFLKQMPLSRNVVFLSFRIFLCNAVV